MSYIPPHKRKVKGQAANNTTKQISNRFDKNVDEQFFCEAFSFVRCINLARRPEQWDRFCQQSRRIGSKFVNKVLRFDAVDGQKAVQQATQDIDDDNVATSERSKVAQIGRDVAWEWETTQNSLWDRHVAPGIIRQLTPGEIGCALSHVSLWKDLVTREPSHCHLTGKDMKSSALPSMLIFEDDAAFLKPRKSQNSSSGKRFLRAFRAAYNLVPEDWDILYLGFSDRGERRDLINGRAIDDTFDGEDTLVQIFQPTYGFHTHAYAIRLTAAETLIQNLPVVGPIDVWLADNQWFGLKVYCTIAANEGWKKSGSPLVGQDRNFAIKSSVGHSGR